MAPSDSHCTALSSPSLPATLLASVLVLGILVSYLPQHIKIIRNRSSEGLSPWWVLLGGLSSIAAIGNILTLPASREDIACCKILGGGECVAALLGVAQIGCQWGCFMFIVMLYLTFHHQPPPPTSSAASITSTTPSKRHDALLVGLSTLLALLIVGITSIALVSAYPHHTQTWADLLGTIAGTLAAIQYLPQIYYTWKLGDVKSLSVGTMVIQVPGAFVFAFSLWLRVGWKGWSTWLVYIVTGLLQAVLLVLAIGYSSSAAKRPSSSREARGEVDESGGVDAVDGASDEPDERTRLLGSAGRGSERGSGGKARPIHGVVPQNSHRQLSMLYAATPPEHDSDSDSSRGAGK